MPKMSPDSVCVYNVPNIYIKCNKSFFMGLAVMATVVEMQSFLASELTLSLPSTSKISKHKAFLIGYASLLPSKC